jgi:hypothetical protein
MRDSGNRMTGPGKRYHATEMIGIIMSTDNQANIKNGPV